MAEPGQDDQDGLKKKLVHRIALAGVAAVVLLGGLAVFEHYLNEEARPPATPVPPPAATVAAPQATEEKKEEPKAEEKKEEVRAEPEKTEMPLAPAPEPRPATRVVIKPPAPAPAAPAKKAAPTKVERVEPAAAPAPTTPAPAAKADPATVIPQGDFLRGVARSYRLQMGVFAAASNAEELHARLEKAGIPSYVESRVHVGPFKTQKEADEARRKLKELGLGPGLLIPPQKR